jgi:aminoglycoside phosphotransferase
LSQITSAELEKAMVWCASIFGPFEGLSDHSKLHGGHASSTVRMHTGAGWSYLKVHHTRAHWEREVHAYEHWARAFGDFTPRLLAVCDQDPLALVISELPGKIVEDTALSPAQSQAVWQSAGAALRVLHESGTGEFFGACRRDGACAADPVRDAREFVSAKFQGQIEHAIQAEYVDHAEQMVLSAAVERIPAFQGEHPLRCHRDYCAANWLVGPTGTWTGVIDYEFSGWDVRVADFSRDPGWTWMRKPERVAAFFAGYGRRLSAAEEEQLLVAYTEYALSAIVWGRENSFFGFEGEGHAALARLAELLKA